MYMIFVDAHPCSTMVGTCPQPQSACPSAHGHPVEATALSMLPFTATSLGAWVRRLDVAVANVANDKMRADFIC